MNPRTGQIIIKSLLACTLGATVTGMAVLVKLLRDEEKHKQKER